MNARWIMAVGMLMSGVGAVVAQAKPEPVYDRYTSIPERNVFGLRPPPPPPAPVKVAPPPPSVTVKLTGIISVNSRKKTVLLVSAQGKPPESLVLGENEAEGPVEVKSIDVATGKVKVLINKGMDTELDFDKDGVKPIFTAAAEAIPTPPKTSASQLFSGAASASGAPVAANQGNLGDFLRRASDTANKTATASPIMPGPMHGANQMAGVNMGQFRFDGSASPPTAHVKWPPEQPVSLEESIIHMELLKTLQEKNPNIRMPPLPPTIMTPGQEGNGPPMPPTPGF